MRQAWCGRVVAGGILVLMTVACAVPGGGQYGGPPGGVEPTGTRYINPGTLAGLDGFTHAVKVGFTIYVSGEVALDSTGQVVGPGNLQAQAKQAFANLAFVLHIAGATPADVVKLNIYVVNLKQGDLAVIRAAGADFFPERNPPAGLVLGVQSLPKDGLLIAVDAVAQLRSLFQPRVRDDDRLRRP